MTRFLLSVLLLAVLSFALVYATGSWWLIAICAFVACMLLRLKGGRAFGAGFLGILTMWLVVALIADIPNERILSARMAELMGLPHSLSFILVAAIIGGLVGGVSGWSGAMVARLFMRKI